MGTSLPGLTLISVSPQGSSLGPILFLLYINDFPQCLSSTVCHLFADDTTVYATGKTLKEAESNLQAELYNISDWFTRNRLSLNVPKSCAMVFDQSRGEKAVNLSVNNHVLTQETSTKLLGVVIDDKLNWSQHITYLVSKLSPKVSLLSRLKHTLSPALLNTVYKSIIQPLFDYCDTVWGDCSKSQQLILQRLQNRAARIITGDFDYTHSVTSLIQNLGWTKLAERRQFHISTLMYKSLNEMAPNYLQSKFIKRNTVHSLNTRSSLNGDLHLPRPRTEKFKQSLSCKGPFSWNSLPISTRQADDLSDFKTKYLSQT